MMTDVEKKKLCVWTTGDMTSGGPNPIDCWGFSFGGGDTESKNTHNYILYARRTWGLALFVEGVIK
jgi:hypothetical protein